MKKILAIMLVAALALALVACGGVHLLPLPAARLPRLHPVPRRLPARPRT